MVNQPGLLASRAERTIAVSRVILGASSLFALWMDPTAPVRYLAPGYALHAIYISYSMILAAVMWNRSSSGPLPLATHVADIALFSVFQYLTQGPSSPFFIYFVFSLFCAALRWDWRATFATFIVVLVSYLIIMGASVGGLLEPGEFTLNRFIIRCVYLTMTGGLLVYLGQHEVRLRAEIERLARWPSAGGLDAGAALGRVLSHAAHIVGAERAAVVWEIAEEPWMHVAVWSVADLDVTKHGPETFNPLVPQPLTDAAFLCTDLLKETSTVLVQDGRGASEWHGLPAHPAFLARLGGAGVASAPFQTDRIAGRVFLADLGHATAELLPLTAVVAREIGASLNQLALSEQLKEIAAREQRILLARDLHDGVLQSLTGLRFELQSVATHLIEESPAVRDRLVAIERALASEQRELRLFIDDMTPASPHPDAGALRSRLEALRERVAVEWKVPVTIRLDPESAALPTRLARAVPLMVHEAIVNALKHAAPSRILVDVHTADGMIKIVVSDDGRGFPFRGHYEHGMLSRLNLGPVSLRERATSLGGHMTIDSTETGSRIEIAVPAGSWSA
jgi:signal transduction histidine kinase